MAEKIQVFEPRYKSAVTIASVTTTSSSVLIRAFNQGNEQVVITNTGTVPVYIAIGDSSITATATDYLILPNSKVILSINPFHTHISAIVASGTGSIYAILGNGLN